MEREKLKELIKDQQKMVQLELQATGAGYNQALMWVLGQLEGKSFTQDTAETIIASQEK